MFTNGVKRVSWCCAATISFGAIHGCYSNALAENELKQRSYYSSVIVGAGWAGIGVAASLKENNVDDFIVLEKGDCIGYFWSKLYDSIRMNTFKHKLWHSQMESDVPDYRNRQNVLQYLRDYANHHSIDDHIQFNTETKRIEYDKAINEWIVHLDDGRQIRTNIFSNTHIFNLTSNVSMQTPFVPDFADLDIFDGTTLHTFEYKNPSQFDNVNVQMKYGGKRRFLVIGCGNSAIEIAGEIKLHNEEQNDVHLLVRNGRHFTKETTKQRFESTLDSICSPSPFSEESLIKDNLLSCNDLNFHVDIVQFDKLTDYFIMTNLKKYGIPKPKLSPTADHYYNKKLTVVDRKTIPLIKKRKINVINKRIKRFIRNGMEFDDGSIGEYDVVIFGTGYRHGLDELLDEEVWNEVSTKEYHYPDGLLDICKHKGIEIPMERPYRWPYLNGRCRSQIYDNLYFAGFDQGYLGGLTIGLYSWAIGEEIAVKLDKMSIDNCTIPWIKSETMIDYANKDLEQTTEQQNCHQTSLIYKYKQCTS